MLWTDRSRHTLQESIDPFNAPTHSDSNIVPIVSDRIAKKMYIYTGMDKTCVYTSFYGFICVSGTDCVQVRYRHIRQAAIPARVVLGTAVFCDQSNQYLVYEYTIVQFRSHFEYLN